jgi:hypothetical protein
VRHQVWTALIAILLLTYFQFRARSGWALSHLTALIRWILVCYRGLWVWLNHPLATPPQLPPETPLALDLDSSHAPAAPQPHFHRPRHPEGA